MGRDFLQIWLPLSLSGHALLLLLFARVILPVPPQRPVSPSDTLIQLAPLPPEPVEFTPPPPPRPITPRREPRTLPTRPVVTPAPTSDTTPASAPHASAPASPAPLPSSAAPLPTAAAAPRAGSDAPALGGERPGAGFGDSPETGVARLPSTITSPRGLWAGDATIIAGKGQPGGDLVKRMPSTGDAGSGGPGFAASGGNTQKPGFGSGDGVGSERAGEGSPDALMGGAGGAWKSRTVGVPGGTPGAAGRATIAGMPAGGGGQTSVGYPGTTKRMPGRGGDGDGAGGAGMSITGHSTALAPGAGGGSAQRGLPDGTGDAPGLPGRHVIAGVPGLPGAPLPGRGSFTRLPGVTMPGVPGGEGKAMPTHGLPSYAAIAEDGPAPAYPSLAVLEGLSGTVVVTVDLNDRGEPLQVRATTRSRYDSLDNTAVRHARGVKKYRPAVRHGEAVPGQVRLKYVFTEGKVTVTQL